MQRQAFAGSALHCPHEGCAYHKDSEEGKSFKRQLFVDQVSVERLVDNRTDEGRSMLPTGIARSSSLAACVARRTLSRGN